jgi:arsenate reductase
MTVTLLYNPRCSKSLEAKALVAELKTPVTLRDYLEAPLDHDALRDLLAKLEGAPISLVRTKDEAFAATGLDDRATAEEVARVLAAEPGLMERPVLILPDRAIIARPPNLIRDAIS